MLPIQLTISGINSYKQSFTVDFRRLIEGQLFGIFGAVGSGKSTLLEAISLALYGQTERLNKSDNRNYNLMNLRSNELSVDFIFSIGNAESEYRCRYFARRNSKNFNKISKSEHLAYEKKNKEWYPIEVKQIPSIIGLTYTNFKRTIIIPQGQFQEFIQLGAADRTRMMKEVFALDKFDLSHKIKSLKIKNELALQKVIGGLNQYDEVSLEVLDREQKEVTELKQVLLKIKKEWEALYPIKDLIFQYDQSQQQIQRIQKNMQETAKEIQILEQQKVELKQAHLTSKQHYEARSLVEEKVTLIQQVLEQRRLVQLLSKKEKQLNERNEKIGTVQVEIQATQETLTKEESLVKGLKKLLPNVRYLTELQQWFGKKAHLVKQLQNVEAKLEENQLLVDQLLSKAFHTSNWKSEQQPTFDSIFLKLSQKRESRIVELNNLKKQEQQLKVDQQLTTWANDLQEGEPCPLCGSLHHPDKYNSEDARKDLATLSQFIQDKESRLRNIDKEEQRLSKIQGEWDVTQASIDKTQKEHQSVRHHLTLLDKQFPKGEYQIHDEAKVDQQIQSLSTKQEEIQIKESHLEWLRKKIGQLQHSVSKEEKALQSVLIEKASLDTQLNAIQLTGEHQEYANYQSSSKKELISEKAHLNRQLQEIIDEFTFREKEWLAFQKHWNKVHGGVEAKQLELNYHLNQVDELRQNIDLHITKSKNQWLKIWNEDKDHSVFKAYANQIEIETQENKTLIFHKEAQVRKLIADLKIKQQLSEDFERLNQRAQNIDILNQLFRGNGFIDYVSSIYLRELCHSANQRFFPLTRQRLKLEIDEKNNFIVRDLLNQGKVRHAKTLSGGQLFQASLCLALALAENIRDLNKNEQQFFFIDEGFGTQDEHSLQLIIKTLKSLRKEGRCVGVISHVESLKQEIDVFLSVQQNELEGSIISHSWDL